MKKLLAASLLAASLLGAKAATTLTAWTFDTLSVAANGSPSPSTGIGLATPLGFNNSYNNTNSVSNPDIQSLAGSSAGGANSWRVRGKGSGSFGGNGWSTSAPLGTQGAEFDGSTFGYYRLQVSFDIYATVDAEANLQVQYTTDAKTWNNAVITSAGTAGTIVTNINSANTITGTYVKLATGWNNQITVDLSGLSGADNNASFGIRVVNASVGTDCVDTTGAGYDNTSGSWTFDNVVIQGTSIDTIVDWTFDNYPSAGTIILNPLPVIGAGTASSIGFNNNYTYAGSATPGSTNGPDVTSTGGSSSGNVGPNAWRVRGNPGNNGWNTAAPIGTQGAEYDVSTAGYSNVVCSFDLYSTSQGESKMCVLYTTDGWVTTNVATSLFYGTTPAYIVTNAPINLGGSANTVVGTYFYETLGQGFFNNIIVDFTGVSGVQDNALFGFRIVNAATGFDCVAFNGGPYNNSSGNWRFDNVVVGGTSGTPAPALAFDPNATVDAPFTNTFTDDPIWRSKIAAVYVNGLVLTNTAYTTNTAGMMIFTPAKSVLLQSSGNKNISVVAASYGTAKVTQPLLAGVAVKLAITTQPAAPSASGGTLTANPVLLIADQYANGTTNPYANVIVTANANNSSWFLGGSTIQAAVNGIATFTNLTATATNGTGTISNSITFSIAGYAPLSVTNSSSFNIGAAPAIFTQGNLAVLQLDTTANNTTFSLIEVKPSLVGQTAPVNIVPIQATGTNALRLTSSGSCGKLSLSDDGTLLCFAAFVDDSAATLDETLNLNRATAALNYTNQFSIGLNFTSISPNGSQARSAVTVDNVNWIADDKGGLYYGGLGGGNLANPNLNAYNNIVVRSFGGTPYVETQKTANGQVLPVVYALGLDPDTGLYDVTKANNLTTDPLASDFYLVSTNNGSTYDILYVMDGVSATNGIIKKYSWVSGIWAASGSFTNSTGGDSLFATPNGIGGAYLYYTTAAASKNSIIRVTDATGWNAPISITTSNVIYTAPGNTYVKGLTFVPLPTAHASVLTPPPILTAQTGASVSNPIYVTNTPDNSAWRSAITGITVNGVSLPSAAYNVTQTGKIIFYPSQSTLLQGSGQKSIIVTATGYSADAVVQTLIGVPSPVVGSTTLANGKLTFAFTNLTGLSFSILATNNIAAPKATWPLIGTAVENPVGSGQYQFSDSNPATNGTQFYLLRQP